MNSKPPALVYVLALILLSWAISPLLRPARGQSFVPGSATTSDPCASPNVAKSGISVATSSATTANLVAASGSTVVYVCAFALVYASGTTPTVQFIGGTTTTTPCDTNAANLTPAMTIGTTAGNQLIAGPGHAIFATAAARQLCIKTVGTGATINGLVTYVQQ